jgi:glucokinase
VSSVIGVDLGGTKVVVACLRGREMSDAVLEATDRSASGALIDQLAALVGRIRPDDLAGVGIGVPSVVEFETGRVVSSVNIPLTDVPLRQVLGERLGVPVFVDNDATAAALAEAHDLNLRLVARNLVMLTIGTGLGGGIVLGGRIYRGATGGAGEFGHTLVGMPVDGLARVPAPGEHFPQPGSLEYAAAGRALDRLAAEACENEPDSALGQRRASGMPVLGAEAVEAAKAGDPVARQIVEIWAERVGIGVANAINTFDPEEVVIGGGAARAGEMLLEPARRIALGYVVPGLRGRANIRLAWHGVSAGVLGAALLAAHELGWEPGGAESGGAESGGAESGENGVAGGRPGAREPLTAHEEASGS